MEKGSVLCSESWAPSQTLHRSRLATLIALAVQVYKPATAQNQRAEVMFMREYHQGKLVKETVLRVKDYDLHRKELKRDQRAWKVEKKQAAKVP